MRTDNDPGAQLGEAVSAALYQNSHYGIPVIGWAHEMAGLDRRRCDGLVRSLLHAEQRHRHRRRRRRSADEVKTLGRGDLRQARRAAPSRRRGCAPTRAAAACRADGDAFRRPRAPAVARCALSCPVLCHRRRKRRPRRSMSSSEILGGSTTSRLYRQLVVEQGIATSAGAGYQAARHRRYRGSRSMPRRAATPRSMRLRAISTRSSPTSSTKASPTKSWPAPSGA